MSEPSDLDVSPPKDWQNFERRICDLFSAEWQCDAKPHGSLGELQHGVDIYGQPKGSRSLYGIQCKKKDQILGRNITTAEIQAEVEKAKEFRPAIQKYIIVTSGSRNQAIQKAVLHISQNNQEAGLFSVEICFWEDILRLYDKHLDVFCQHYPKFCPPSEPISNFGEKVKEPIQLIKKRTQSALFIANSFSLFVFFMSAVLFAVLISSNTKEYLIGIGAFITITFMIWLMFILRFWNCLNACDTAICFAELENENAFKNVLSKSSCLSDGENDF